MTITKIVDVVPLPARIAVLALIALALALAVRSWLAAMRAKRLEQQREELLEDVGLLQGALLPTVPAKVGPVATSVAYRPADGPGAGGDFYDVFALKSGQIAVVVGDLSGHGRQALQHTALMRFTLRAYLDAGLGPRETLKTAGAVLSGQLGDSFATVIVSIYDPRERTLTYSSAGHPPPFVFGVRSGDAPLAPVIAAASPLIGPGMRTGLRETVVSLTGACAVCFYTDGVTDARVGNQLFGEARLERTLRQLGAGADAQRLLDRVAAQTDRHPDDMAACVLCIEGDEQSPRALCERIELDGSAAACARAERLMLACGVDRVAAQETLASLRSSQRAGPMLLEVDLREGSPTVTLRPHNVTSFHALDARRAIAG